MKAYDYSVSALKDFSRKKLRSLFSVLSITIGVTTIVFINICSSSGIAAVQDEMSKLGVNCDIVKSNDLNNEKIANIQKLLGKDYYLSTVIKSQGELINNSENINVTAYNCDDKLLKILNYNIVSGRNISIKDLINSEKIIIIDRVAAKRLFNTEEVIDKNVLLSFNNRKDYYKIVGVTDSSIINTQENLMIPPVIFIPHTLYDNKANEKVIYLSEKNDIGDQIPVQSVLNHINKNTSGDKLILEDSNLYKENINYISNTMSLILLLISMISIISGCFNMINTIFSDIDERKKEIALKKALGETNIDISFQFIIENITTMLISSISGIIIGNILSYTGLKYYKIDYLSDICFHIIILISAVLIGVFFGLLPIRRIFKTNPVDIL